MISAGRLASSALFALVLAASPARGQAQVGSGRALDASLRLGSGGYNAATQVRSPPLNARPFVPYRGRIYSYSMSPVLLGGPTAFGHQQGITERIFFQEQRYVAGWQWSGGPGGASPNVGAHRIDGRVR